MPARVSTKGDPGPLQLRELLCCEKSSTVQRASLAPVVPGAESFADEEDGGRKGMPLENRTSDHVVVRIAVVHRNDGASWGRRRRPPKRSQELFARDDAVAQK